MNNATPLFHRSIRSAAAIGAVVALAAVIAACGGEPGGDVAPTGTPGATSTTQPPASAATAATPTLPPPPANGYRLARILPDVQLEVMTGAYAVPGDDDAIVVLTQPGQLWRVSLSGAFPTTLFGDLSDRLGAEYGWEQGLLGLAFPPDFEREPAVFVFYSASGPNRNVVARFTVAGRAIDLASETRILEVAHPSTNHNGGQIAFGPDGYLYVALGDGDTEFETVDNGQDLATLHGSILRIDPTEGGYDVPADNPFVGVHGARPEIYAFGLRNPWRFSLDTETGDLWAADVGEDRWEEIDRIIAGGNYGWSRYEGFHCLSPPDCDSAGLSPPRAEYGHEEGCSITGGYVYRGNSMPELDGWYVYGDFCTGFIWAFDSRSDGEPVRLAETGRMISSFAQFSDGEIVAVTFDYALYRLARVEQ